MLYFLCFLPLGSVLTGIVCRVDFFHLSIAILYSYLFIWFIVVSGKINEKE